MSEEEKDPENILALGVDKDGFFMVRIHVKHGARNLLGFLEQAKDIVKQFYAEQFLKEQEKKKLVEPHENGMLNRFKNKWL